MLLGGDLAATWDHLGVDLAVTWRWLGTDLAVTWDDPGLICVSLGATWGDFWIRWGDSGVTWICCAFVFRFRIDFAELSRNKRLADQGKIFL